MAWLFGNSEEKKKKKQAQQAQTLFADGLARLEAEAYDEALDLFRQAQALGHEEAATKIAELEAKRAAGTQAPQSSLRIPEAEARALLEKGLAARDRGDYSTALTALGDAAKGGLPEAIFEFGQMFFTGRGVERSLQRCYECAVSAAKLGYPRAMLFIGTLYLKGIGLPADGKKAAEWLEQAAELGDASAQFNLALLYSKGDMIERNWDKAIPLAEQAAAQGHEKAQELLDNLHHAERDEWMNEGVSAYKAHDFQKAAFLFRQSAAAGSIPATFNLALCYENGEGVRQDRAKALEWYETAAEAGHARAQCCAGTLYENGGEGEVEIDPEKAVYWYEKAAEQGNDRAQALLASAYRRGFGVPQDPALAVQWYTRAASQGNAQSQYDLGLWYIERARDLTPEMRSEMLARARVWLEKAAAQGFEKASRMLPDLIRLQGGGQDRFVQATEAMSHGEHETAFELFRACAEEEGVTEAMFALAQCYEKGEGVEKDLPRAFSWYRKAAEAGHPRAMLLMGMAYENGGAVKKDMKTALNWYRRAAQADNARAMLLLGVAYEAGHGVEKDMKTAQEYYLAAYRQGDELAQLYLGMAYRDAAGELQDLAQADALLRPLADKGQANAMREMALLEWSRTRGLRKPEEILVHLDQACEWAKKSQDAGDKKAEDLLKTLEQKRAAMRGATPQGLLAGGLQLLQGKNVKQDVPTALKLLQMAVEAGNGAAAGVLGLTYAKGEQVKADLDAARGWFEKGAVLKNPESMMNLAHMYANGLGIPQDLTRAADYYRQAGELGFGAGAFALAQLYRDGRGVPQDKEQEFAWARRAAEAGYANAQYHIAAMYWNGDGVGSNIIEARSWMTKAAEQNFPQAKDMLARMDKALEEARQRRAAQQPEGEA